MKGKSKHTGIIASIITVVMLLSFGYLYVSRRDHHPPTPPDALPPPPESILKGTIGKYGSNPDKDIDKLLLQSDAGERWLHFPPNAAKAILSVAQPDDKVEVSVNNGNRRPAPDHLPQQELASVTNLNTGKTVSVHHIPPPPPAEGKEVEITGTILDYIADDKGNMKSIVINRSVISLPPPARDALLPLLTKNKKITVKGWQRSADAGFVNEDSFAVIRPYAVVIDGTEYSIR